MPPSSELQLRSKHQELLTSPRPEPARHQYHQHQHHHPPMSRRVVLNIVVISRTCNDIIIHHESSSSSSLSLSQRLRSTSSRSLASSRPSASATTSSALVPSCHDHQHRHYHQQPTHPHNHYQYGHSHGHFCRCQQWQVGGTDNHLPCRPALPPSARPSEQQQQYLQQYLAHDHHDHAQREIKVIRPLHPVRCRAWRGLMPSAPWPISYEHLHLFFEVLWRQPSMGTIYNWVSGLGEYGFSLMVVLVVKAPCGHPRTQPSCHAWAQPPWCRNFSRVQSPTYKGCRTGQTV